MNVDAKLIVMSSKLKQKIVSEEKKHKVHEKKEHKQEKDSKTPEFIQAQNPLTKTHIKIDTKTGRIVAQKKPGDKSPFKGLMDIKDYLKKGK